MDKNAFGRLLDNPSSLTPEEWEELRRERDRYPFSAPLQYLMLVADKVNGAPLWEKQSLPRVALYFQDPDKLYTLLESASMAQSAPKASPVPQVPSVPAQPMTEPATEPDAPFDILQEINSYQEISFKTAPKSVILTNFLEKDGGIRLDEESADPIPVQELAKKSIANSNSLESETLAIVLEKQGKYAQALAMYEKLMVNNPEKSSTFAIRIVALRELINNSK